MAKQLPATNEENIAEIHRRLTEIGIENGALSGFAQDDKRQVAAIQDFFAAVGLSNAISDVDKTAKRVAKMFKEISVGTDYRNFPDCTTFSTDGCEEILVTVEKLAVRSICEHHILPIEGHCRIGYLQNGVLLGLSKFSRIVDFFSRRPQTQERLTRQIHEALKIILKTEDVVVSIYSTHACMRFRGVKEDNSYTNTSACGGKFLSDAALRAEFYTLTNK